MFYDRGDRDHDVFCGRVEGTRAALVADGAQSLIVRRVSSEPPGMTVDLCHRHILNTGAELSTDISAQHAASSTRLRQLRLLNSASRFAQSATTMWEAQMAGLIDFAQDANALLEIEPEDLGLILITLIRDIRPPSHMFTLSQLEMPLWNANTPAFPQHRRREVARALAEAWQWLQTEGLIMHDPEQSADWLCLTRRGARLKSPADIEAYRKGGLLPASTLQPVLLEKVRPMFLRGDYELSVLAAFRQVEINVRAAAGLPENLVGVDLVRTAFNPTAGALTDKSGVPAEREALAHLFAGAIGHAKNPGSHRIVVLTAVEAAELIGFASYLLGVVEARAPKK